METKMITVKRLKFLSDALNRYSHRWDGDKTSQRMYDWVDEYQAARETPVWEEYCKQCGFTLGHDAYDCMA